VVGSTRKVPHLPSLGISCTGCYARSPKNEWSEPWDSQDFKRLPSQPIIRCVVVALSFSDREYLSADGPEANAEYLCGDLLRELIESLPSLKELRLLHVPYLHAPFIWPSPEVLSQSSAIRTPGTSDRKRRIHFSD
jgi:hypothetical protein